MLSLPKGNYVGETSNSIRQQMNGHRSFRYESQMGIAFMAACECGAKGADSRARINIFPHLSASKYSSCFLRHLQELNDLAEGNMTGHLVHYPAPIHLLQTKSRFAA